MAEVKAKVINLARELARRQEVRRGLLKGGIRGWPALQTKRNSNGGIP